MAIRKYLLIWSFTVLCFIAGALILVGRANAETIGFSLSDSTGATSDVQVTVLDEQTQAPIPDATVQIGDTLDTSLAADPVKTSAKGLVTFARSAVSPKALTVSKAGYATLSLVGAQSSKITVFLKALPQGNPEILATGTLGGWPDSVDDGAVEAGLVFKSLSAFDLLDFQVDSFISPLKDSINVMGSDHDIPSNIILPDQNIIVGLFPIEISKPNYRLPMAVNRTARLAGLQGQAMVDDLLPSFQGGGSLDIGLLNQIKFTKLGLTDAITPTADFEKDVDASVSLRTSHRVTVNRPPFDANVIVAAATDLSGDRQTLLPTDVKLALAAGSQNDPQTVSLSAPAQMIGQARDVLTIAEGDKGKILSGIVTDQAGSDVEPGDFLSATELGDVSQLPAQVSVQAPAQGVAAVVFDAVDSDQGSADVSTDRVKTHPIWMVYALPSASEVTIPTARLQGISSLHGYASSQFEFGQGFDERNIDGQAVMRNLTRFTRVSSDITQ